MLLWAPRAERSFRALMLPADQVVWHHDERPARSTRRRRQPVQATLI